MATLKEMLEAAMNKSNATPITLDRRKKVCQIANMYLELTCADLKKFTATPDLVAKAQRFLAKLNQRTAKDIMHLTSMFQEFVTIAAPDENMIDTNIPLEFGKILSVMTDNEINLWFEFETQILESILQK